MHVQEEYAPVETSPLLPEEPTEDIDEPVILNKPGHEQAKDGLGGKNIGKYGSFVYIVNQIFGPGMLAIPLVLQQGNADFSEVHSNYILLN